MRTTITPAVKSAVNAYLLARAHAEIMREKVDAIQRRLLTSAAYYADPELTDRRGMTERITDPKYTFLMKDDEFRDYYMDVKKALIEAGFTIREIPERPGNYYCPALTAEDIQRTTEHVLIDAAAEMLGEASDFRDRLLCAGLDQYHRFIDLTVSLVVNSPGFKNPLTGNETTPAGLPPAGVKSKPSTLTKGASDAR